MSWEPIKPPSDLRGPGPVTWEEIFKPGNRVKVHLSNVNAQALDYEGSAVYEFSVGEAGPVRFEGKVEQVDFGDEVADVVFEVIRFVAGPTSIQETG